MNYDEIADLIFQQLRKETTSLTNIANEFNRGEIGVLGYLAFEKDEVLAGILSEKLNVSTARIASILNSLENKGYIKRMEDKNDKRKTLVAITKEGKTLAINTKNEITNKIVKVIKEIGCDEIKEYARIALKIRKVLEKQ